MKRKVFILLTIVCSFLVGVFVDGCANDEQKEELEDIVIQTSNHREDGNLTMYDQDGNEYLRFDGIIHIDSDGSNGQPIKVRVYQNESEDYEFD